MTFITLSSIYAMIIDRSFTVIDTFYSLLMERDTRGMTVTQTGVSEGETTVK